ncbi:MAG TPA: hypothetical protein VGO13_07935 [Solirubrobacterales bacterium]|jgi:hypothetical protein|nr:hypothetical protein [Solirubrobacterales bacterium]
MGRGRSRTAVAGVIGVFALALAGCGAETHPNDQRPQVALRVSVTITPKAITVQPAAIGVGPARTQQIPQNEAHAQPPIKNSNVPVTASIVIANQTRFDSKLRLRGPRDVSSVPIPAGSPATLQTDLPTGTYVVTAANVPSARLGRLVVGPYRASSQNDVLLP